MVFTIGTWRVSREARPDVGFLSDLSVRHLCAHFRMLVAEQPGAVIDLGAPAVSKQDKREFMMWLL